MSGGARLQDLFFTSLHGLYSVPLELSLTEGGVRWCLSGSTSREVVGETTRFDCPRIDAQHLVTVERNSACCSSLSSLFEGKWRVY